MNDQHQHELDIWTRALNLPEYEVVHYAEREGVRHFSIVPTCVIAVCPDCSKPCDRWHQKRWVKDIVDLPLGDQPVQLKVRVFQFDCWHCGRIWTPKSLLFTPGMGAKATGRFVERTAELIERADISGVAAFYDIPRKTLERWYYEWLECSTELSEEEAAQPIRSLGMDELSLKKKHGQYVAAIIDHTNQRVLEVLERRTKEEVKAQGFQGLWTWISALKNRGLCRFCVAGKT